MLSFVSYTITVYINGSGCYQMKSDEKALQGQMIWQQNNCQACHQLYGLGGYMGPDLTNVMSEKSKGADYVKLFIRSGSIRMPALGLNDEQADQLVAFLKQMDRSGKSIVRPESIDFFWNYTLAENKHE